MLLLQTTNLRRNYGNFSVLKGIDLTIESGEVVSIVGASGAGKTTLLQILGTLDRPDSGELHIAGQNVFALSDRQLARFRNEKIGFVFQFNNLLPEFSALENVCLPGFIAGKDERAVRERAESLLTTLGLADRLNNLPSQLSGGEQQRTAVARALINDPAIVFADEPSGNLDSHNAEELHQLFFRLRDELGQTFIIVTHNEALAALADRTVTIRDGVIVK
ncbi:ABC transporter ATP-binding protein [Spirosoma utsteinense]|uniref:Lipoprotein-releasing system ATP-binding protein n=1 Tax=Spirosoma utsteinense TaxID=2585773 RepID=A0ABR6W256_9BACT|nr:ABC transporter ATP-binding protein [Spirosoma utsteinense]MBC3785152.1 lipoprotein-releasing system ATP-binding protein [Spirosoma utsteinense]MBC3790623.1 lipoprotein-releasing system ATP-binding protein [Spirosoma utsteinense]